jgi:hypothetical protein
MKDNSFLAGPKGAKRLLKNFPPFEVDVRKGGQGFEPWDTRGRYIMGSPRTAQLRGYLSPGNLRATSNLRHLSLNTIVPPICRDYLQGYQSP